jgi:uncharacterized protein
VRIHLETGEQANLIRTYGPGRITIQDRVFQTSLIVLPHELITDWPPQSFEAIAAPHMQSLAALDCEVILLGTGRRLRFPAPALLAPLAAAGIGWEIMDTGAACRTYNILMAEGRKVAAALLQIETA